MALILPRVNAENPVSSQYTQTNPISARIVTFNEAVIRGDHTVNMISLDKFLLHTFSVAQFVPLCTHQG